mmetsp:Transcript_25576/g.52348  ORF Transcript_25576/g.52348 Transcript_25576/m.52348 type:complete len:300 (-) Transcript_25576:45-944(-)
MREPATDGCVQISRRVQRPVPSESRGEGGGRRYLLERQSRAGDRVERYDFGDEEHHHNAGGRSEDQGGRDEGVRSRRDILRPVQGGSGGYSEEAEGRNGCGVHTSVRSPARDRGTGYGREGALRGGGKEGSQTRLPVRLRRGRGTHRRVRPRGLRADAGLQGDRCGAGGWGRRQALPGGGGDHIHRNSSHHRGRRADDANWRPDVRDHAKACREDRHGLGRGARGLHEVFRGADEDDSGTDRVPWPRGAEEAGGERRGETGQQLRRHHIRGECRSCALLQVAWMSTELFQTYHTYLRTG